jgi:hypothetical protein
MGWYHLLGKGLWGPHRKKVDIQLERPTSWLLLGFEDHQVERGVNRMTIDTRGGIVDSSSLA